MRISNDIHYPVLELCKKVIETPIGDNMYIIPNFISVQQKLMSAKLGG